MASRAGNENYNFRSKEPEKVTLRKRQSRYGYDEWAVFVGLVKSSAWMRDELAARRAFAQAEKNYRPCMCCKNFFMSTGPGNRMCSRCRTLDMGLS